MSVKTDEIELRSREREITYLHEEVERLTAERDRWRSDAKERAETMALLGAEVKSLRAKYDELLRSRGAG